MEFLLISLTRASPYYQANEALPFNRSYQYELLVAYIANYCPGKMYDDILEGDNMTSGIGKPGVQLGVLLTLKR